MNKPALVAFYAFEFAPIDVPDFNNTSQLYIFSHSQILATLKWAGEQSEKLFLNQDLIKKFLFHLVHE